MNRRRRVVDGWMWWATFRAGIARHHGIVTSAAIANAACASLWGKPPQLRAAVQDLS